MKVLLVYPQYNHSNEFDSRAPSMSLPYLAAVLERSGHEVVIYDASLGPITRYGSVFRYGFSDQEVSAFLASRHFDVVGISCSFSSRWKFASRIASQVKELSPGTPVVVGGLFPTYSAEFCLKSCPSVDCVVLGEGELTFNEIVTNISRGHTLTDSCTMVDGVSWRGEDRMLSNPKVHYNDRLDDLPFPAWHLVDLDKYFALQRHIFELAVPCLPILSSRSCPNRCRFCNMYLTHGSRWRARSAENLLNEIEYLGKRFGVSNFYFIDDNFSVNLERAKNICRGIMARKLRIRYNFHNGLSINAIDGELVELMKASGCTSVCLGIESGSERIRNKVYGKRLSTERIVEVFKLFRKARIPTVGYFMVGAPGETRADIQETKKLLAKLPMSLATVGIYTPYPETELYDECKEKGWLVEAYGNSELEMFSSAVMTPDFNPDTLVSWQKELYLSFIWHHWPTLIREALRPGGIVNLDMIGKFFGIIRFRSSRNLWPGSKAS